MIYYTKPLANSIYYHLKPIIPRLFQIWLRRQIFFRKISLFHNIWPIDQQAGEPPVFWPGWPENKRFALILTHDVDTAKGMHNCWKLANQEEELGFHSSFNFVPERYKVSTSFRHYLDENGFEVGVHGLNHDGKLYESRKIFKNRAERINTYLKDWNAVGFRSPAMHHNLEWIHDLDIEYDASTFDTDPFEPQSDGVRTIFPFWVKENDDHPGYIELPYTLPQDFTLFILMKEKTIDVWKKKLEWVAEKGGMVLLNTHPDYMNFEKRDNRIDEYHAAYYTDLLKFILSNFKGQYWHVLPKEIAHFWRSNYNS